MEVMIHVPDTLVQRLQEKWGEELPRYVIESWVLEDNRAGVLTTDLLAQATGADVPVD